MTSLKEWIYSKISKNKQSVSGKEQVKATQKNYVANDVSNIGEFLAYFPLKSRQSSSFKAISIAIAGLMIIGGSRAAYSLIAHKCETGLEKLGDKCIDPFLLPYLQATQQGEQAVILAQEYKSIADLQQAQLDLSKAIKQLSLIPTEALIYPQSVAKLREYHQQNQTIAKNLEVETVALDRLQASEQTAQKAKSQTSGKRTSAELKQAKAKWLEAKTILEAVDFSSLAIAQAEAYRLYYDRQIQSIDRRLAAMAKYARFRHFPNK